MLNKARIAIVYDWLDKWGGVERILLQLAEMFPQADFYTSYFDPIGASWAKKLKIKTSYIQKLPDFIKKSRTLSLPLYPYAFESFNFYSPAGEYDLVISVTSSFAKAIITKPKTFHLCYLLTPTRYLWVNPELYIKNKLIRDVTSVYFRSLKKWDLVAIQRPDKIISISQTVKDRCQKIYQRESDVIYPPFDVEYWDKVKSENSPLRRVRRGFAGRAKLKALGNGKYYLIVSRLEPYKRVDLTVNVFNKLPDKNLIIVGKGSEKTGLEKMAKKNIYFIQDLTDSELAQLYTHAEALIMPQEEDFGYVALEAQFMGTPVIAYGKGGAKETVTQGQTGLFFDRQDEQSLMTALERFQSMSYNLRHIVKAKGEHEIEKFSKTNFSKSFIEFLNFL